MSAFKDWVEQRDIEIRKELIEDYLSKCPFIEMHRVLTIEREGATIDIAFDEEYEQGL